MVFVPLEYEGVVAVQFRCHQRVRRRKLRRTCNFQVSRMSRLKDRICVFFVAKKNRSKGNLRLESSGGPLVIFS